MRNKTNFILDNPRFMDVLGIWATNFKILGGGRVRKIFYI